MNGRHSPFFYQMLHALGVFPPGAPPTVRMFASVITGKLDAGQLVDRYDLACRPVRDLLADYLRERQPGVDYITLNGLSAVLALWFWKDLETHHPGISSLRLPPDIAAAWKQRLQVRAAPAAARPPQSGTRQAMSCPGCGPSTSTWRSGRKKTRPGGGRGRSPARSGPPTSSTAREPHAARHAWTSAPANLHQS